MKALLSILLLLLVAQNTHAALECESAKKFAAIRELRLSEDGKELLRVSPTLQFADRLKVTKTDVDAEVIVISGIVERADLVQCGASCPRTLFELAIDRGPSSPNALFIIRPDGFSEEVGYNDQAVVEAKFNCEFSGY